MSKGFPLFADAPATGYVANELYVVGGQTALGDAGQGVFRFASGASLPTGVNVIAVTGGQLQRVTEPNSELADLIGAAVRADAQSVRASPLGAGTQRSGTITAGGTAQVLMAANADRIFGDLQNTSAGVLRVNEYGTASVSAGYEVKAGGYWTAITGNAVSVWGATTGQTFIAQEKSANAS